MCYGHYTRQRSMGNRLLDEKFSTVCAYTYICFKTIQFFYTEELLSIHWDLDCG